MESICRFKSDVMLTVKYIIVYKYGVLGGGYSSGVNACRPVFAQMAVTLNTNLGGTDIEQWRMGEQERVKRGNINV